MQVLSFFNYLLLAIVLWILRIIAYLPLPFLRILAQLIGILVYCLSKKNRKMIQANLVQANITLSVLKVTQAITSGVADMLWVWFHTTAVVVNKVHILPNDQSIITQALNGNCATILLTPHLGCFEVLAKWIAHRTPLTAMYRPPKKQWVAKWLESVRNIPHLTMAKANISGVRLALKTLKSGGLLGILPDQVPKHGEGVWIPWFGRDAYTINLPAKLHLTTQARIYIIYAIPIVQGWQIQCEPVGLDTVPWNEWSNNSQLNTEPSEMISLYLNKRLESIVTLYPLYYAWSYNRYKSIKPM